MTDVIESRPQTWEQLRSIKLRRRGTTYAYLGFPTALIGVILCALSGLADDVGNIHVPGAQVGILLIILGFVLIGRAVYLDWLSRQR